LFTLALLGTVNPVGICTIPHPGHLPDLRALSDTIRLAKPTLQALALRLSLGSFALVLMVFIHIFIIVRCLWINQLWWFGEEQISKTNTPCIRVY